MCKRVPGKSSRHHVLNDSVACSFSSAGIEPLNYPSAYSQGMTNDRIISHALRGDRATSRYAGTFVPCFATQGWMFPRCQLSAVLQIVRKQNRCRFWAMIVNWEEIRLSGFQWFRDFSDGQLIDAVLFIGQRVSRGYNYWEGSGPE